MPEFKKRNKYIDYDSPIIFQGAPKKISNAAAGTLDNDVIIKSQLDIALIGNDIPDLVKIGEIDYNDLNACTPDFISQIEFTGAKPAGKYIVNSFTKVVETPVSYSGNKVILMGVNIPPPEMPGTLDTVDKVVIGQGIFIHNSLEENITVALKFTLKNAQDWSSGLIAVYLVLKDIPTLS